MSNSVVIAKVKSLLKVIELEAFSYFNYAI